MGWPTEIGRQQALFGRNQVLMVRELRRKPVVIAFDDEAAECYFYEPEQVRELFEAEERRGREEVFWSEDARERPFEDKLTYEELLDRIKDFCEQSHHSCFS